MFGSDGAELAGSIKWETNISDPIKQGSELSHESISGQFNRELEEDPMMRDAFEKMINQHIVSAKVTMTKADILKIKDAQLEDRIMMKDSFRNGSIINRVSSMIEDEYHDRSLN